MGQADSHLQARLFLQVDIRCSQGVPDSARRPYLGNIFATRRKDASDLTKLRVSVCRDRRLARGSPCEESFPCLTSRDHWVIGSVIVAIAAICSRRSASGGRRRGGKNLPQGLLDTPERCEAHQGLSHCFTEVKAVWNRRVLHTLLHPSQP